MNDAPARAVERVLETCSIALVLTLALPGTAPAVWRSPPTRDQMRDFLAAVDSVAVWSLTLPDSAAAGERFDAKVLEAAHVRRRVLQPRAWGQEFVAALLAGGTPGAPCIGHLVREDPDDTAGVVIAAAEMFVDDETVWVPVLFRDRCAPVFLPQGLWGGLPIGGNRAELVRLIRQALPEESGLDTDSTYARRHKPQVVGIDSLEELPEAIKKFPPRYPDIARQMGVSGTVSVMALIGKDGRVRDTRIRWSIPMLDEAAEVAVRDWRFKPARSHGDPVSVWVMVPVKFTLR